MGSFRLVLLGKCIKIKPLKRIIDTYLKDGIREIIFCEPPPRRFISGIIGLKSRIQSKNEIAKIITQPKSCTECELIKGFKSLKYSLGIIYIIPNIPDITGICEEGTFNITYDWETVFQVQGDLKISFIKIIDRLCAAGP